MSEQDVWSSRDIAAGPATGNESAAADDPHCAVGAEGRLRRLSAPVALVLVVAVLTGLGVFFVAKSQSVAGSGNTALVDTGGTTEVSGQIKDAVEKIFSYSYDNVEATESIAKNVLAGAAVSEYETLFRQVRERAPEQRLVLSTRVTNTGVRSLDGESAHLLVFLDQIATRVDTNSSSASASVLSITAERREGLWKITSLVPR